MGHRFTCGGTGGPLRRGHACGGGRDHNPPSDIVCFECETSIVKEERTATGSCRSITRHSHRPDESGLVPMATTTERTGPQCVLGDVGGTNIRLALIPASSLAQGSTKPLPSQTYHARYKTVDFSHLRDALTRFVREKPADLGRIVSCALSVCGPVCNGRAICLAQSMGPDGWVLEEADLAGALGLSATDGRVRLLNDFIAVGLAVGEGDWKARPMNIVTVHAGSPQHGGSIGVLGPGTGLGSCLGVWPDAAAGEETASVRILPSEGGESDFVARSADEWALRQHIASELGVDHVKVEHVVSGSGLAHIYGFLRARAREEAADRRAAAHASKKKRTRTTADATTSTAEAEAAMAVERLVRAAAEPGAEIAARGAPGAPNADAHCVRALEMFIDALGAEAANVAIRFQAHGGVYIAGGVAAKLASTLVRTSRLRDSYLGKGRSTECYSACPLYILNVEGDALAIEGTWKFAASNRCCFRELQSA
jgi:glucokinase